MTAAFHIAVCLDGASHVLYIPAAIAPDDQRHHHGGHDMP
jgi:hypothetical protein